MPWLILLKLLLSSMNSYLYTLSFQLRKYSLCGYKITLNQQQILLMEYTHILCSKMNKYLNQIFSLLFSFPLHLENLTMINTSTRQKLVKDICMILFNISLNQIAANQRTFSMSRHSRTEYIFQFFEIENFNIFNTEYIFNFLKVKSLKTVSHSYH